MHRPSTLWIVIAIVASTVPAVGEFALADDPAVKSERAAVASAGESATGPVPSGVYELFTAWQKVRLGATSLVKPEVAGNTAVVYAFVPVKGEGAISVEEMLELVKSGQVRVAVPDQGNANIRTLDGAETIATVKALKEGLLQGFDGKGWGLSSVTMLSTAPRIGKARPESTWIAWQPDTAKKVD